MGLFTGLSLAALVLILDSPGPFHTAIGPFTGQEYFALVSTYVAMVGAVSAITMIPYLEVGGGLAPTFGFVDRLGTFLFFVSIFGFMGTLPLLLVAFSRDGAIAVLSVEVVLLAIYFVGRRFARSRSPPHS